MEAKARCFSVRSFMAVPRASMIRVARLALCASEAAVFICCWSAKHWETAARAACREAPYSWVLSAPNCAWAKASSSSALRTCSSADSSWRFASSTSWRARSASLAVAPATIFWPLPDAFRTRTTTAMRPTRTSRRHTIHMKPPLVDDEPALEVRDDEVLAAEAEACDSA